MPPLSGGLGLLSAVTVGLVEWDSVVGKFLEILPTLDFPFKYASTGLNAVRIIMDLLAGPVFICFQCRLFISFSAA